MKIQFITDVGRRRRTNQDSAGFCENKAGVTLALVADGMGGHQAGDIASSMLIETLVAAWKSSELKETTKITSWLKETIQAANEAIHKKGQENEEMAGMGTTLVAVVVLPGECLVAHVGDSRVYLLREQGINQLTEDHSLVHELVKSGEITEEMAANHPRRNVLTRSVGGQSTVEVDVTTLVLENGDTLLLCSDGLTNMVANDDILAIVETKEDVDEALHELVNHANEAGGADNITALLMKISDVKEVLTHG
ncbi:Stp1/IreP family PP2C-type Ser/Thr phosphatase [Vagococcus coleopterorum]|uniref:protein-serine/threonine phosphatase n=1 Tax=Vagococcus coleopterorum TaxID=2714946 RepID=A0A6G8AMJ0_9ENTE|nr:Stp1/IreP family PP2C-type Ser/Thr phosphatase [Vagococcus coleopterorum]QIL46143.1 Stp1/IreP family PP2C-type Ser/Thr phosphatase [Vagococcus coleopterorum]